MKKNILLSLCFVIRYCAILLLVFLLVGTYRIEVYGILISVYYIAINYLAIKYGIIYELDKREKLDKNNLFKTIALFLLIFNIVIYIIYKFSILEVIILSIISIVEFYLIKTKKEKQRITEVNTQKAIDEYFKNKR